jgi:hypothetical protein
MAYARLVFWGVVLMGICCFAAPAAASTAAQQPAAPAKPVADKPVEKPVDRTTAVAVEHEGTDTLGAKLAFQLKGTFNSSSLFTLTDKDQPKLRLFIATKEEFPSRPHIASVYSLVWAFSQGEGTLNFLLAREVGVVDAGELEALVAKTAEYTDGIAAKYSYLFNK